MWPTCSGPVHEAHERRVPDHVPVPRCPDGMLEATRRGAQKCRARTLTRRPRNPSGGSVAARRAMIMDVGPGETDGVAERVAPRPGPGLVVARPRLWQQLGRSARVTVVTAPAGSGKTVLLRSWISQEGLPGRVAWVAAGREEQDPRRFWLSVVGALRRTAAGAGLVRAVSAAPDLDGWALTERLLTDLASLPEPLWLVVDDVHELGAEAQRQLELLILR